MNIFDSFRSLFGGKLKREDIEARIRSIALEVADVIDQHDIIVPDVNVSVGKVNVALSFKRLDNPDAKKPDKTNG